MNNGKSGNEPNNKLHKDNGLSGSGQGGKGQIGSGLSGSGQGGKGQIGSGMSGSGQGGNGQNGSGMRGNGQSGNGQNGSGYGSSQLSRSGQSGNNQNGSGDGGSVQGSKSAQPSSDQSLEQKQQDDGKQQQQGGKEQQQQGAKKQQGAQGTDQNSHHSDYEQNAEVAIKEIPYVSSTEVAPRLEWMRQQFDRCSDIVFHNMSLHAGIGNKDYEAMLIYTNGMFDIDQAEHYVLQPLLQRTFYSRQELSQYLYTLNRLPITEVRWVKEGEEARKGILQGHGIVFFEGDERFLILPFSKFEKRGIEEAPNETVIRGPREAFVEDLQTNLSLVRRRIKSHHLKMEQFELGTYTSTRVIVSYLEGVCKPSLIDEVKRRIHYIQSDGVLAATQIEEDLSDNPTSIFTQMQHTERPDVVSAALLEGRIAIMMDNSPDAMLAPATLFMKMQSLEDYNQNFIATSFIRIIRFLFMLISLMLPSFYIAVTTFHAEILPFNLLISVASAREIVPFPALLEAFIMEISFEALREASVRIPKYIGQTVSIIGALIIGTAAVEAGIVSSAMVIIVSVTGVASFIIPGFDLSLSLRLLRFPLMLLAGFLGIFGIACGVILIYTHLLNLKSMGVPFLSPWTPSSFRSMEDIFIRSPWWKLKNAPTFALGGKQEQEQHSDNRGWAKQEEEQT